MAKYEFNVDIFKECLLGGLRNIPQTLELTVIALTITLVLGLLVAFARFYKVPVLSQVLRVVLTALRGTPIMLVLLITNLIYSSNIMKILEFLKLDISPADINMMFLGVLVLAVSILPYSSEAFVGALLSIDKIQFEAGYSLGLTTPQLLRKVIIPQVIPAAMPTLMNLFVSAFKASAMVYTIGIVDVMYGSLQPCAKYYRYLEGYIAAAVIFWGLSIIMNVIINIVSHFLRLEKLKKESKTLNFTRGFFWGKSSFLQPVLDIFPFSKNKSKGGE